MSNKSNWLDPLNRQLIQASVKIRATTCKLRDGRILTLNYGDARYGHDTVTITPQYGWIPRGEFEVKTVLMSDWTERTDNG